MTTEAAPVNVAVKDAVNFLRINGDFAPALREVSVREITKQSAKDAGMEVSDEDLQRAADVFRQSLGLNSAEDTNNWLVTKGLTVEDLEDYLETNLLISRWKDQIEDEADHDQYIQSEVIQETVRELIYQDWLDEKLQDLDVD